VISFIQTFPPKCLCGGVWSILITRTTKADADQRKQRKCQQVFCTCVGHFKVCFSLSGSYSLGYVKFPYDTAFSFSYTTCTPSLFFFFSDTWRDTVTKATGYFYKHIASFLKAAPVICKCWRMLARLSPPSDKRVILSEITKKKSTPIRRPTLTEHANASRGTEFAWVFRGSSQYGHIRWIFSIHDKNKFKISMLHPFHYFHYYFWPFMLKIRGQWHRKVHDVVLAIPWVRCQNSDNQRLWRVSRISTRCTKDARSLVRPTEW